MFSIDCAGLSDFEDYEQIVTALAVAETTLSHEGPTVRPSFQFDYREVGLETIKTVLGYAKIAVTNTPLGVVGSFEPIGEEGEWVVFPLTGLRQFLESTNPVAVANFDRCGSLDTVFSTVSQPQTPGDQLVIAVLECLHFCQENNLVLAFAW